MLWDLVLVFQSFLAGAVFRVHPYYAHAYTKAFRAQKLNLFDSLNPVSRERNMNYFKLKIILFEYKNNIQTCSFRIFPQLAEFLSTLIKSS